MSQQVRTDSRGNVLRNRGITAFHEDGALRFTRVLLSPGRGRADRNLARDDRPRH